MQFVPERPQVYTVFSTSQWLVCIDAPDEKATLKTHGCAAADLTVVANGLGLATHTAQWHRRHEWRDDRPMPSYTFGFAAGHFTDVTENRAGHGFRYVGPELSAAQLRRIFTDSPDMMRFFEDRSGVPYSEPTYAQALVANTIGQEMSGF